MFGFFRKNQCAVVKEQLSAYLDGRLGAGERQAAEKHLESCETCRKELAQIRTTIDLLRGLPRVLPRRSFTLSEEQAMASCLTGWQQPALRSATAAAAILLALVFLGDFLRTSPTSTSMQSSASFAPAAAAKDPAGGDEKGKLRAAAPAPAAAQDAAPKAPQPPSAPGGQAVTGTPALAAASREGAVPKPPQGAAPSPVPAEETFTNARSSQTTASSLPFRELKVGLSILMLALGVATLLHWRLTANHGNNV